MFGDTELLGIYEKSMDSKGRINIPSVLKPEAGEQVGLAYGPDYNHLLLMTLKSFKELYEKLSAANNKEVLEQDPKLIEQMKKLIGLVEVDKQGRVQIPKYVLQKTGLEGNITMIGQITCMGVYKSK